MLLKVAAERKPSEVCEALVEVLERSGVSESCSFDKEFPLSCQMERRS